MDKKVKEREFYFLISVDSWDSFIGQSKIKQSLKVALSAVKRQDQWTHFALRPSRPRQNSLAH